MYFSSLENSKSSIPKEYVKLLDYWLASMTALYHKKINPRDFAIQNGMDIHAVLELFDLAVENGVLLPKIIVISDEQVPFGTFYSISDVPNKIEDYENSKTFIVEDHNMEVWYELIACPKAKDVSDNNISINEREKNITERPTIDALRRSGASKTMKKLGLGLRNWKK